MLRNAAFLVTPNLGSLLQVNKQELPLLATLSNRQLKLHFCSLELWAEASLEQEPSVLHLAYDWQRALSLQVTYGYCEPTVSLCSNFTGPDDDVSSPDPGLLVHLGPVAA